jgi:hypothetical protein
MEDKLQFRLYPRGFLGGGIKPQVIRTNSLFKDKTLQHQYEVNTHESKTTAIAANPIVEALYAAYIRNNINTSSMEFRTSILEAALDAFGTTNFAVWYSVQFDNAVAGDLHNRFLDDILKFIEFGRRDMSLETWASLLIITDEGDDVGYLSDRAKKFFGIYNNQSAKDNIKLVDVIQKWCSKPGGLEDLLGTLHILFGNA